MLLNQHHPRVLSSAALAAGLILNAAAGTAQDWNNIAASPTSTDKLTPISAPANTVRPPAMPSPEIMLVLLRTNLLALDHALKTNNFAVLHKLSGPLLQVRFSVDELAQSFASLRARRISLAVVAIATPVLTETPGFLSNGMLRLVGRFAAAQQEIKFEMILQAANGEWRLAGVHVH